MVKLLLLKTLCRHLSLKILDFQHPTWHIWSAERMVWITVTPSFIIIHISPPSVPEKQEYSQVSYWALYLLISSLFICPCRQCPQILIFCFQCLYYMVYILSLHIWGVSCTSSQENASQCWVTSHFSAIISLLSTKTLNIFCSKINCFSTSPDIDLIWWISLLEILSSCSLHISWELPLSLLNFTQRCHFSKYMHLMKVFIHYNFLIYKLILGDCVSTVGEQKWKDTCTCGKNGIRQVIGPKVMSTCTTLTGVWA